MTTMVLVQNTKIRGAIREKVYFDNETVIIVCTILLFLNPLSKLACVSEFASGS